MFQIIAYIIEGRSGTARKGRRPNSGEYRKLANNVEDTMPNLDKGASAQNVIY